MTPPPGAVRILSFTASPSTVAFLGKSTLSWSTENATACTLTPDVGSVPTSGSVVVESAFPGESTTYTLACEGPGGPATATVTVATTLVTYAGDFTAESAAELASLAGANVIQGSLTLRNASNVTSLDALEGLVRVEGDLVVDRNPALEALSLPYLERVGGSLAINQNAALSSLDLPALARVEHRLYISRNFELPRTEVDALITQLQAREGIGGALFTYENDPAEVLSGIAATFFCTSATTNGGAFLELSSDGRLIVVDAETEEPITDGTYSLSGTHLNLAYNFYPAETTANEEFEFDLLITFTTPSFSLCYAVAHEPGYGVPTNVFFECPSIGFIPGVGFERNSFTLYPGGHVEWLNTQAITAGQGDEIYRRRYGVYVQDGGRLHFAFGNNDNLRFLSASADAGLTTLLFDELEPEAGPCTRQ